MLTRGDVLALVGSGELEVAYAFDCTTEGTCVRLPQEAVVTSALDTAQPADRMFAASFFGDRLDLSLGPVVLSHRRTQPGDRTRFKGRKGTIDLTESSNRILVEPGELLTVHSIERIRLGGQTAALLLPRLTLATAGLRVTSSYIDPGWDGILQLSLANDSPRPYELRLGERIAVCRFYLVSSPVTEEHMQLFPQKSHHFGLTWARVLDTDDDPVPLRKQPVARRDLAHIWSQVRGYWKYVAGAVGVVAIITGLMWVGGKSADLSRALSLADKVDSQQTDLAAADAQLDELEDRLPNAGSTTLEFAQNDLTAFETLAIESSVPNPVVLVSVGSQEVTAAATVKSQASGLLTVEVSARRSTADQPLTVLLSYAVL